MARKKTIEKRPRRSPGSGTIRHRAGRTLPFEACFIPEGGEGRYHSFQSYEAAAAWLDEFASEQRDGTRDIAGGSMLVQDFLPMWLGLRQGHISPKTMEAYQYYCEYACGEGGLSRLRMDEIEPMLGQRMVNRLAQDGFQNTGQLKSVLYQAFEYAFDPLGYIRRNPFLKVRVPPIERREGVALTKDQRTRMLDAAIADDRATLRRKGETASAPAPLLPLWHLCSRLAFRRGEADALRWSSVDMDAASVSISATRGRLGAGHIEGKTKTKKPRVVPLPPDLLDILHAHRTAQKRAALAHGWRWSEGGYVFADDRTGEPISVDHIRHRWSRIRAAANLPPTMRVHDLRHTALTILELDGVPESIRMALGGHSTHAMASHYTRHAALEDVRRAIG